MLERELLLESHEQLREAYAEATRKLDQLRAERTELHNANAMLAKEVERLKVTIADDTDIIANLTAERDRLTAKIQRLRDSMSSVQSVVETDTVRETAIELLAACFTCRDLRQETAETIEMFLNRHYKVNDSR